MVAYSFKKQFIEPILAGLGELENVPPKRQTIRSVGRRRHARPGETIQLYTAMRTKQCRKLGEALCKSVEPIRIFVHQAVIEVGGRKIGTPASLDDFARSDGFTSWAEMQKFWFAEHEETVRLGPFVGVLIRWNGAQA